MVDGNKVKQGNDKCKKLEGAIHSNLELLRKAMNSICESQSITKPEELETLNTLFDD